MEIAYVVLTTVRPRDTRPQDTRTLQVHIFELAPKKFEWQPIIDDLVDLCKKKNTVGPRLVQILGPGKNRTSEIRTSEYYIANFH